MAINAVGVDYSPNIELDVYFNVTGPSAISISSYTDERSVNSSNTGHGSWITPTIYTMTGTNSGYWQLEVKVHSQFGLLATAYDSISCD